jgi:hypothetical protein
MTMGGNATSQSALSERAFLASHTTKGEVG